MKEKIKNIIRIGLNGPSRVKVKPDFVKNSFKFP